MTGGFAHLTDLTGGAVSEWWFLTTFLRPGSASGIYSGATCKILAEERSCGGAELHTLVVERDMIAASTMAAGGDVAFEQMKLPQLKEELAAREAKRAGMKAVLQRRLHALLVHAAIARRAEAQADWPGGSEAGADEEGSDADEEQEGSDASGAESLSAPEVVQQRGKKRRVGRPVVADSSDEEHAHR